MKPIPPFLSARQASIRIGCSLPAVYKAIERGNLRAERRGNAWAIHAEALDRYLLSDAETIRRTAASKQRERMRQQRRSLARNQRAAEIEAAKVRDEVHELLARATAALGRFSAAIRRAQSTMAD